MKYATSGRSNSFPASAAAGSRVTISAPLFIIGIISDDTFIGAYLEKAKVLEKLNRFEEAIENYKITIAIEGSTAYALIKIGYCYERLKNSDLALQHYYQAVEEDPALDRGWMRITKFFIAKKDYHKALFHINKAIDIDSGQDDS